MSVLEELRTAVAEVQHGDLCIEELERVLDEDLVAFNVSKGVQLDEAGASTWHEVAVLTPTRIILWFADEATNEEEKPDPDVSFETQTRITPLRNVSEVSTRCAYAEDDTLHAVSIVIVLKTQDVYFPGEDGAMGVRHDTIRFVSSGDDKGAVQRCYAFARAVERQIS